MTNLRQLLVLTVFIPLISSPAALADDLPTPGDRVILTVSGKLGVTNTEEGTAAFDLAMLDALPQASFETATIWTDGVARFSGVELSALLEAVAAEGTELLMTALNDYAIELPASEAIPGGPILATRVDGNPLSVRDKGPIWLIYPFDDNPSYKTEVTYSRSIWQLKSIKVED
ncbi:oxidoreductase [Martelella endophytica]|uniref:Oxidoreductase n=1 Tax=Martelella endophytica TaxID=1486262 RepID=A0A0D5LTA4_MAREN|nr:oxidoreductase [Martelella endophytica]AJY47326.1 oxidoreductase [Martelella endophytica]